MTLPPLDASRYLSWITRSGPSRERIMQFLGDTQRIYRFQIFDGYTLLHDFVPVQASDGKLGLYDTFGDKGFRQVVDQSCATSGGAYSGSDSDWLEIARGPGSVYYLR